MDEGDQKKNHLPNYQHILDTCNPYYVPHTHNCHFLFHLFPDVMQNDVPVFLNYLLKNYIHHQNHNENVIDLYKYNLIVLNIIHLLELFLFLNQ